MHVLRWVTGDDLRGPHGPIPHPCVMSKRVLHCAAEIECKEAIRWYFAHAKEPPDEPSIYAIPASKGHIEFLNWLARNVPMPQTRERVISTCMREAPLDVLDLLVRLGFELGFSEWLTAVECKRLDLVEWLERNGCKAPQRLVSSCARTGNLAVLERCFAEIADPVILNDALLSALRSGQLAAMKWLSTRGAKLVSNFSSEAGAVGSAEIIQHLQDVGYSLDAKEVRDGALESGHHELLNFIDERLGPCCDRLDEESWRCAFWSGSVNCVEWMASHSSCVPPCIDPAESDFMEDSRFINYLVDKGYAFKSSPMELAVSTGDLNLVRRFYSQGYFIDADSYKCALLCDHAHILKWFHEDMGKVCHSVLNEQRPGLGPKVKLYLLRNPVKPANK